MYKPVELNVNFPELEKKLIEHWYKNGIVDKYLHKNDASDKRFSFQDGPITANNPMGVHHAWGRSYKDLWQKFFNLLGYKQRFNDGFDCQGLWVEVEVEKELGLKTKKDIENLVPGDHKASIAKFVQLCKDRVYKFADIQTQQTKRLGNFMDWDNPYYTMSDDNNYMIWHFLKKCFEYGWIYKGHESVPWCPRCETAISQHEMLTEDYKELVHEAVYLKFEILNPKSQTNPKSKIQNLKSYLLVWTTTPWTIPANIAVVVEEKFDYSLVEMQNGELFWIAKELVESVLQKDYKRIVKTIKGKELVGLKYKGPFDDLPAVKKVSNESETFHTVIATDEQIMPITLTEGTGLVHSAVSAGTEDFRLGQKRGLPLIPVIEDNADYREGFGYLSGKNAKKHPELILDYLKQNNWAYKTHHYKHRYPACWRCKTELVWKVADEWYISMDTPLKSNVKSQMSKVAEKTFRQMMIEVAKKITWMPGFGLSRELDWLKNMHDWLISKKNRYWGLALPIYECKKCKAFEVLESYDELKERAVSGWEEFEGKTPHKPYIDEVKIKCSKCGEIVSRIDDVGNPWLDAGIVPFSTIKEHNQGEPLYLTNRQEWKKWFPVDFITESFPGQFKNWFYSLIAMSAALEQEEPFKTVLGFGTLLGEDGRPMHKSWGNSIEFNEGADKIGVDVMRWMYARTDPADNMLFGYKHADEVRRQFYLMLWNTYRFFVEYATLDKFDSSVIARSRSLDKLGTGSAISNTLGLPRFARNDNLSILDQWILSRLNWLIKFAEESLRKYDAQSVALEAEKFVSDLSTWYVRRSRDRVWVNSESTEDKKNLYTTLHHCLVNLSIIISPILPFITEEIYTNLTGETSVHLSNWPHAELVDTKLLEDMQTVRNIVEVGHRLRKENKLKVRQILASVTVSLPKETMFLHLENIEQYKELLMDELNVKTVEMGNGKQDEYTTTYDTTLTDELKKEGEIRELIRAIQKARKEKGLSQADEIILTLPAEQADYADLIKRKVIAHEIRKGKSLSIEKLP